MRETYTRMRHIYAKPRRLRRMGWLGRKTWDGSAETQFLVLAALKYFLTLAFVFSLENLLC